jgi:hypothetical protein
MFVDVYLTPLIWMNGEVSTFGYFGQPSGMLQPGVTTADPRGVIEL